MQPVVRMIECKTILNKTGGFLNSYTHTLNPYAGCAFGDEGCGVYCYAAELPSARQVKAPWGLWVNAKMNAASSLERELAQQRNLASLRLFMSSVTDPYQPCESKLGITRQVLSVLRSRPVGLLVLQTRCPLVERDYDLIREMPFAWLSVTVETDDDRVRSALTPICPSIERRIQAMRSARRHGIRVQAAISPVLPHNLERFADLLAESADRVVVDTFVAGDGSCGDRTARRPVAGRYIELGWGDWRDETEALRLYETLRHRLGPRRVVWSSAGFNDL